MTRSEPTPNPAGAGNGFTTADVRSALESAPLRSTLRWTERDVLLYHLSLGAGRQAATDPEERYTLEGELCVLPTFALVAGQGISSASVPVFDEKLAGLPVDPRRMLHAGQQLQVRRPLPASGEAELSTVVSRVLDKGTGALVVITETATDRNGAELWASECRLWVRGAGGFGGDAPVTPERTRPSREPDRRLVVTTEPGQALLYRLNGDMNPLHADRRVAASAGFDRPILHGLASYGLTAKALVDNLLDGAATRLVGLDARFRAPVLPGQSLEVRAWVDGDHAHFEVTCPEAGDVVVLDQGLAQIQ